MSATFTVTPMNAVEFERNIDWLTVELSKISAGSISEQVMKVGYSQFVRHTPPFGPAPASENYKAQKAAGSGAIRADSFRAFHVVDDDVQKFRQNKKEKQRGQQSFRSGGKVQRCDFSKFQPNMSADEMNTAQNRLRRRMGRVGKVPFMNRFVVKEKAVERLNKLKTKRLGIAKSGWVIAFRQAVAAIKSKNPSLNIRPPSEVIPSWVLTKRGRGKGLYTGTGTTVTGASIENLTKHALPHADRIMPHALGSTAARVRSQFQRMAIEAERNARRVAARRAA